MGSWARGADGKGKEAAALSHGCYNISVEREITQRQLRNESGEIMRELDRGQSFLVTRNGVAVGQLVPARRKRFVPRASLYESFKTAAPIDEKSFRADIDSGVDQAPEPKV